MLISMVEYKSFLNFVADRVKDLKELDIEIAEGSQFTMSKQFYTYIIDTVPELNKAIDLMTTKYFEDKINQNVYLFIDRFNEFFAFAC
jgi:stalled ribosome rescue protein Dom34